MECVPNFSEGRDKAVIDRIVSAIETSGGVKVLDVDPGEATNRTVVTFVGSPEAVVEAAFAGVKKAAELIDMRKHKGAHPRMGATDVLPLIPIAGITLEECAELARKLAERIAGELHVTVGTLTTNMNSLERKGYLTRNRSTRDKRVVLVTLTEKGRKAFFHHRDFHRKMIHTIIRDLDEEEMKTLIKCLGKLDIFFRDGNAE